MRENTGRQTVTTINFTGRYSASTEWTQAEVETMQGFIDDYADAHRENALDPEYLDEYGQADTFEYEVAGLRVVALLVDGAVMTVWAIEDQDIARYHTAARTGRTMRIRYVKPDGAVSRREVEVTSVSLTKAGHIVVRAHDRRKDEGRTFRADRITHTTLHRATAPIRPTKRALAAAFQASRPAVTETPAVSVPAPRTSPETVSYERGVYSTAPGTAAALEAPEEIQDRLAAAYAEDREYLFVTV